MVARPASSRRTISGRSGGAGPRMTMVGVSSGSVGGVDAAPARLASSGSAADAWSASPRSCAGPKGRATTGAGVTTAATNANAASRRFE